LEPTNRKIEMHTRGMLAAVIEQFECPLHQTKSFSAFPLQ
jgi:hypothetical protein